MNTNYINLYQVLIDTNINKIKTIKDQMNNYIDKIYQQKNYNNLPPYLDYMLYMLTKSFPIVHKYYTKIIPMLLLVNNLDIHPAIFQQLFTNILYSIFIDSNTKINNVYDEIEIMMSIFNDIFINVDLIYKSKEDELCYNHINSLSNSEFSELIDKIDDDNKLNDIMTFNIMIVQIEHLTQINMNEYFSSLNNNTEIFNNKLDYDLLLYDKILIEFNKQINNNYNYMTRFEHFNKYKNIDLLKFESKNSIYYWIDYIALINKQKLDLLFKKSNV
jgi:hypothetical protein